ncbi:MAG TPA: helix-turn-helix domain-containing protein [Beijerinckiaceae bacterium]|nr:helix-turn-helix domain-containing protein [Beijerinckiaceae bacterium]
MANDEARGIGSLENGLAILRLLRDEPGPIALGDLSDKCGMAPSKLHRYCISLVRAGFAVQEGRGSYRYADGSSAQVSAKAIALEVIRERLPQFVKEVGHTTFVSEWQEAGPKILHVEESDEPISVRPKQAGHLAALTSSTGKLFLSRLPEEKMLAFIAKEQKRLRTLGLAPRALSAMRTNFLNRLDSLQRSPLAFTDGDHIKGISSMTGMVDSGGLAPPLAVTVFGISETFTTQPESKGAKALLRFVHDNAQRIRAKITR